MDVQPCSAEDLAALVRAWPSPGNVHEAHYDEQRDGRATFLVAWRGDEPLGTALVQWHGPVGANARAAFPNVVEVNHLQVRTEHRGQGVGTAIIRAAETLATGRGCARIAVGVGVANRDAARLYARLGYRNTGTVDVSEYDWTDTDGRVRHELETDELLVKVLTGAG